MSPHPAKALLKAWPELEGARAISLLMQMPDSPVHCIQLCQMLSCPDASLLQSLADEAADHIDEEDSPSPTPRIDIRAHIHLVYDQGIPLTDIKTVRDIYRRLNRLISQKAHCQSENVDHSAIDTEICALKRYLSQCLRPGGIIRNSLPEQKKAYDTLAKSIRLVLNKARATDPEAYHYLKTHLKMGNHFTWIRD
ncbi:MAG: hypothetical protein U1C33_02930 [Candidatus Cloacimonadaceae bacterium]|nr:hypothetical protein [Candidatus Cloacimonadaceae bacterium]